ncbi:MAG: hypothetical protein ABJA67_03485 [Chthonomonadales bacterium]
MPISDDQIRAWLEEGSPFDQSKLSSVVDRIYAEEGRMAAGSSWDKFIVLLKSSSKSFRAFLGRNEHAVAAVSLAVIVVSEVSAKHQFDPEEAHLLALGVLHAILQVGTK